MMRNSRSMRMHWLPTAVADVLLDVHETHVYQPLRKGLEKVATASSTLKSSPQSNPDDQGCLSLIPHPT